MRAFYHAHGSGNFGIVEKPHGDATVGATAARPNPLAFKHVHGERWTQMMFQ